MASVTASTAADLKNVEIGLSQEVVSATDETATSVIAKIEGGLEIVGKEIVKGAGEVIEAVKEHPELIAE